MTTERNVPHSLEAEKAILGAILLHSDALNLVSPILMPEDFFRDAHRRIFRAMLEVPSGAIDLTTLRAQLDKHKSLNECGGPAYISSLVDGVPRSANVEHYSRIVKGHAIRRGIIQASSTASDGAYAASDEPSEVIDRAFTSLLSLSHQSSGSGLVWVGSIVQSAWNQLEQLANPDSTAWGHRSGLKALDRRIRGFRKGKMIVVAGRPGDGKTSLALNVATAAAKSGVQTAVFSLEQDRDELMLQLVSSEAQVNIEDLADQKLTSEDWTRVSHAHQTFSDIPLHLDDTTDLNPISLRAKTRQMQIEKGLGLVVVDYVQLMQGLPTAKRHENDHERLTGVSRSIKLLAKDLGVPIIVCCQLNRAPDARQDGRPLLSDLRGSGSLEQDADSVILIYDPSKHPKKKSGRLRSKGAIPDIVEREIQKGVVELIVAKNRGLSTGTVQVFFEKTYTKFRDLEL